MVALLHTVTGLEVAVGAAALKLCEPVTPGEFGPVGVVPEAAHGLVRLNDGGTFYCQETPAEVATAFGAPIGRATTAQ